VQAADFSRQISVPTKMQGEENLWTDINVDQVDKTGPTDERKTKQPGSKNITS